MMFLWTLFLPDVYHVDLFCKLGKYEPLITEIFVADWNDF